VVAPELATSNTLQSQLVRSPKWAVAGGMDRSRGRPNECAAAWAAAAAAAAEEAEDEEEDTSDVEATGVSAGSTGLAGG
jgi:hypothetical protein